MSAPRPLVGSFQIKVIKAKELEVVQLIGKQDPYVVIEGPAEQKYKSKWHDDGGRTPVWEQTFHIYFPAKGDVKDRVVKFVVWDKNLVSDNVIGHANFNAGDLLGFDNKGPQWHGLTTPGGKYAGSIFLDVHFTPGIGITVHEGKDLRDVQKLGKQDPYVVIQLGDQKASTKEVSGGGTAPKWTNETHFFSPNLNVDPEEQKQNLFVFDVVDANVISDTKIGQMTVPYSELARQKGKGPQWYPIYFGKKDKENAGQISLTVEGYTIPTS